MLQVLDADRASADMVTLDGPDAMVASRRMLRDLAALLALPAMWVDHDPDDIAAGLVGVLFGVLRLESAYVRFDGPGGAPALERWRPDGPSVPTELQSALTTQLPRQRGAVTTPIAYPSGDGIVRVTSTSPTLPGEHGLVLVASRRVDFPNDLERHLLQIAVGQATISIHTARRLASERAARIAAELALDRRNAFLASLAQDLTVPFARFAEWATQAHAFAAETDRPPAYGGTAGGAAADVRGLAMPQVARSPLPLPARLTRREAEVLGLLAQGLSNKEIAAVLWLSERTVERHITSLYRKIEVERRSEATAYALRHGLIATEFSER